MEDLKNAMKLANIVEKQIHVKFVKINIILNLKLMDLIKMITVITKLSSITI